jgi:hypothetical protein
VDVDRTSDFGVGHAREAALGLLEGGARARQTVGGDPRRRRHAWSSRRGPIVEGEAARDRPAAVAGRSRQRGRASAARVASARRWRLPVAGLRRLTVVGLGGRRERRKQAASSECLRARAIAQIGGFTGLLDSGNLVWTAWLKACQQFFYFIFYIYATCPVSSTAGLALPGLPKAHRLRTCVPDRMSSGSTRKSPVVAGGECKNTRARCVSVILDRGAGTDWLRISQRGGRSVQSAMEGAAGQMLVPILGIVAVAAVTFYTVSFMEMRDVRFAFPLPRSYPFPPSASCWLAWFPFRPARYEYVWA